MGSYIVAKKRKMETMIPKIMEIDQDITEDTTSESESKRLKKE